MLRGMFYIHTHHCYQTSSHIHIHPPKFSSVSQEVCWWKKSETHCFNLPTQTLVGINSLWNLAMLTGNRSTQVSRASQVLSGKESICQYKTGEFDPLVWKIPWRSAWQPTPVFLPGKCHGQRSLAGYSHRVKRVRHDWAIKPPPGSEASNTILTSECIRVHQRPLTVFPRLLISFISCLT